MKDFDTFTKIVWICGRFGQNNCCHRLWKVAQSAINRPIWSHWPTVTAAAGQCDRLKSLLTLSLSLSLDKLSEIFVVTFSEKSFQSSKLLRKKMCGLSRLLKKRLNFNEVHRLNFRASAKLIVKKSILMLLVASPVWPDLEKFRHLDKLLKMFREHYNPFSTKYF